MRPETYAFKLQNEMSLLNFKGKQNTKSPVFSTNTFFSQQKHILLKTKFLFGVDPCPDRMSKNIDFGGDQLLMILFSIAFLKLLGTFHLFV